MNAVDSWETKDGSRPRRAFAGGGAECVISLTGMGTIMQEGRYRKFQNDCAVPVIRVGMREFNCIGASPPHDHPHVYINMGDRDTILCPYCATQYSYDARLSPFGVDPQDSIFVDSNGVV
jgi:uncharacterized Zn-finger protein